MRVLIHDYAGHGFTLQLARALAARSHDVSYLHGGGLRAPRASMKQHPGDPPKLQITPVGINEPLHSRAGPQRLLQERRYGAVLATHITSHQPDVVLSVPSSLDAQRAAQRAAKSVEAGFVYWLQDVYSEAVERLLGRRIPAAGKLLAAPFARLERDIFRRSDAIVAITDDFLALLQEWRIPIGRVTVIPNWAPLDEIRPLTKVNSWSTEHRLADSQVLMYSGTLGRKHDPTLLLALADGIPDARIVVVAEGAGSGRLGDMDVSERTNLVLLPLQPAQRHNEVLATADVLVAILDADANVFSVPSKVLTYLAAGRPILAAIPHANLAARTIMEAGAGRTVEPSDRDGFVAAARDMLAHSEARAAAGIAARAYAETAFAIVGIAEQFEAVLSRARPTRARSGGASDTADARD
ncbi:MAG: glycosyltransferase family 4 protein, partial [Candidatus Limnocylindria bacterium]